ncbi:MAG: tyrosine-type recombinase/integrase [Eubacteriales bacterium]
MEKLKDFEQYLVEEEKSKNTIRKYLRDVKKFLEYLGERTLEKRIVLEFKEHLQKHYEPTSVNSILAAVNHYLTWDECMMYRVKPLKIQKAIFENPDKELCRKEYLRLVSCAKAKGDDRTALILQTICSTGIRVSELEYITVSAAKSGRSDVKCKGKNRMIYLSKDLCRLLKEYCSKNGIKTGSVFVTKSGKCMDRSNIWKKMKQLCKEAKVAESKVFPHNLRHLFAKSFYEISKDIAKLADLLGHCNINTTRIYTMESGSNHRKQLDKMNLLLLCTT